MKMAFGSDQGLETDFYNLCELAGEAHLKNDLTYVEDNIHKRVKSEDVIEAYLSLNYVDPDNRYEVFKEAAETTLEHEWNHYKPLESLIQEENKKYAEESKI